MVKSAFSKPPRKGTRARKVLIMMLKGATNKEIFAEYQGGHVGRVVRQLQDDCGYDIRSFRSGGNAVVYKCIGKMKWDGGYRSFIHDDVEKYLSKRTEATE